MDGAPPSMSDARGLAADLAALDEASLERVLRLRGVPESVAWRDFFDAAEGLLDEASIDRALVRLPRSALADLAHPVATGARPALREHALADAQGRPYRAVAARVHEHLRTAPDAFRVEVAPAPALAAPLEEAAAAERAALGIASLADVLLTMRTAPLARTGTGAVAAADRRRLQESGLVASADDLDELLESAALAGLAAPVDREWLVTAAGDRWLHGSTAQRWSAVVEGIVASLPEGLRDARGIHPPASWAAAYPLDPEWPARCIALRSIAVRWGLTDPNGAEHAWGTRLRATGTADTDAFAALLPPEIDRIYLQADLSAIAPGPLAPALDLRLRSMAVRESRAQASTYRFSPESLATAVGAGETAESLRAFLSDLSLTGIPQPLDYLLESTAARHGLIRVQTDAGGTRVGSDDPQELATLAVDQAVRAVGLVRDGDTLVSRVSRDAVYWTLVDARYPAIAVDATGEPEPLVRCRLAPAAPPEPRTHAQLLATLRETRGDDTDAAWLGRELDAAVRARAMIVVVVAMPDGSTREFTLEATGLGGGRLRGRDRGADTERTLPVSHIVSARPA
ncbi:MAG: helicase-associated domain-containing protein [Microbacterium sp.]|uniref:helicase-associated domain-containing protein n=1 Tax=Microbacterium sp. TaxID=51671 RepID=UPI003A869B40